MLFRSIIDNQVVQLNRSVNLTLNNATSTSTNNVVSTNNASIGTNSAAVLTIIDNDNTFSFSATDYVVSEAAGNLQVNVLRSGQNTGVVSVVCATIPLSIANAATPGADYVAVSATLPFSPGVSNVAFTVPIVNDTLPEGNEFFGLLLTNPLPVGEIGRAHV